jgi:drug/metabolite transporter (DMT)-like permease
METLAVVLVLSSSVMHATWNMLARRSGDPYAFFVCLNAAALILWLPFALPLYLNDSIEPLSYGLILLSGSLQIAYFAFLGAAYRRGGLALVYPIARGTGVAIVPVAALALFDERPSILAAAGIAVVLAGLSLIGLHGYRAQEQLHQDGVNQAALFALLTGLTIACYSLVDKRGVQDVNPIVYGYGLILVAVVLQVPYVLLRKRRDVVVEWRRSRWPVVIGGVLSLGTYVLVLFALQTANVGVVVPLRETSIVFGVILGITVLRERLARLQIAAAVTIGIGALAIAIGG